MKIKKVKRRFVSFIMIQFQVSTSEIFSDIFQKAQLGKFQISRQQNVQQRYSLDIEVCDWFSWNFLLSQKVKMGGNRSWNWKMTNKVSLFYIKWSENEFVTHPHNSIVSFRLRRCVVSSHSIDQQISWWSERSIHRTRHTSKSVAGPLYSSDL